MTDGTRSCLASPCGSATKSRTDAEFSVALAGSNDLGESDRYMRSQAVERIRDLLALAVASYSGDIGFRSTSALRSPSPSATHHSRSKSFEYAAREADLAEGRVWIARGDRGPDERQTNGPCRTKDERVQHRR